MQLEVVSNFITNITAKKQLKTLEQTFRFASGTNANAIILIKSNQFIIGEITVEQYHQIEKTKQKQTTGEKKYILRFFINKRWPGPTLAGSYAMLQRRNQRSPKCFIGFLAIIFANKFQIIFEKNIFKN